jgi:2,4-dienoyl-CoA reductase-like NADH-dependent reductase (Old Yellow Enzyme family)
MSILFEPVKLGNVQIKNRFVHSATYEGMATTIGKVTDELVRRYQRLARGEIGLIIPGGLYVHPLGRTSKHQAGIHTDDMIPGLKQVADVIHQEGSKVVFQLMHAGGQAKKEATRHPPIGPSSAVRDPSTFTKSKRMTETQIEEIVRAFGDASQRAVVAGADGIQLHAAHGYLISQFLSPFYNDRNDDWGGSDENRFRFLAKITKEITSVLPERTPLLVKLNVHDYTPKEGITPPLAAKYARWLNGLGIVGIELSCGTAFSFMNMCRGDVPLDELVEGLAWWQKPVGRLTLNRLVGGYGFRGAYNLEAAKAIRPACGDSKVILVGGLRSLVQMEETVRQGHADFISMCRPFIREPSLVRRARRGETTTASCVSCNKCFAAMVNGSPIRCYHRD